jgi:tRNA-binding protein
MEQIEFSDFKKLQMKVGEIKKVERVLNTKNLYKLQVDLGVEQRQIVSSLVPFYSEEELLNQKIIVLVNLKPTKFCGEASDGMLLCAEKDNECVLLTVQKEIELGVSIT